MLKKPKVFFVGGFLGAGKTTAIQCLAKLFAQKGLKAAAITNDQALRLVDTVFLSKSGLPSVEVAGSCFCCNFNGLAEAINQSIATAAPDVILAEPVGSCTDIVATVIRPMRSLMKDKVDVLAYSVLVEPDRWVELAEANASWSMKFLFDKQIQEADFIVLTKLDTLAPLRAKQLLDQLAKQHPESKVLGISALAGEGMEDWMNLVQATPPGEHWLRDLDYQKYAAAEAEMGWLNGLVTLKFPKPVDGKIISIRLAEKIARGIAQRQGKIGHLKLLVVGSSGSVKVGVTHAEERPSLDGIFTAPSPFLEVTVNTRATVSPGDMAAIVHDAVEQFKASDQAEVDIAVINTFRPGAPHPTHRYAESAG
jgi:G3E family GTPase